MGTTVGLAGGVGSAGGPRRAGTPPGAAGGNIAAQMAQAIAYSGTGLKVPGALINGGSTSGTTTPVRGSPTPGTSTPNGVRSRQASSSNSAQNYQFQDFLGEGSYSSVYTAVSLVNQQVYAIKVIQKRLLQKENKVRYATSERAILSKLGAANHPGIIKLYSAFQDLNSLYFAFELAPNGDLFKQIRRLGSFNITGTRYYAATILDAVTFIHSMNIIHRDLKPENILLDANMRPKISDFGSAKDKSIAVVTTDAKSLKGSFVGTPEYASPEMLVPPTITTRASDIWAYGCVVYQFIAGRPPFKESTDYLTMKKIQEGKYSFPDGFDDVIKTLVEGCLVTNPVNRTTSGDLRKHEFFADIDWDTVWKIPPPELESGLVAAPEPRDEEFKLHWSDLEASEDEMEDFISKPRSDQASLKLQMPAMEQTHARQSTPPPSQAVEPRRSIDETPTQSHDVVKDMVYPVSAVESYLKQRRYSQPTESTKRKVSPVSDRTTRQGSPEDLVSKLRRFSSSSDSHTRPRRTSPSMDRRPSVGGPLEEDDDSEIGSGEGPPSTVEHNITDVVTQSPTDAASHSRDVSASAGLKAELTQASLASTRISASESSTTSKSPESSPTSGLATGFEKVRGAKGLDLGEQPSSNEKPWVLANGTKILSQTESELYSSPVTIRIKRNLLPPKQRRRRLLLTSSGRLLCLKELKSTTGRKKVQVEDEIGLRASSSPKMAPNESQSETAAINIPAAHSSAPEMTSAPSSSSPSKRSSLLGLSLSGGSSITSTLPNLLLTLPGSSRGNSPAASTSTSQNGSSSHSSFRLSTVATKVELVGEVAVTVHTTGSVCTYMAESPVVAKLWIEKLQEAMKAA